MKRRGETDPDDIDTTHLGAATPAPGIPKRVPRKKEPIGFCIDPEAYKPRQQPKRRKRGAVENH